MINGHSKILVTGRSRSGSWQIRGEQLGRAIGATPELNASKVRGYDLAILVKRPRSDLLHRLRSAQVPIVWDVVDAWPQPDGNMWGRERCVEWMREEFQEIAPVAIVAATKQMADDCADFGVPVLALPHHGRPGQRRNPLRERVQAVGYEGSEHYLGHWGEVLAKQCKWRGWRFLVNPSSLSDLDIVVAFRFSKGYAVQHWKSNVKLANAQATGTPCILNREGGYLETDHGGAVWADTEEELCTAFDALAAQEKRRECAAALQHSSIELEDVAEAYKRWLSRLKF